MRGFVCRFFILIGIMSCGTDDPDAPAITPTITSIAPAYASKGSTVTIKGTNLSDASSVRFGGMPAASFTVLGPTVISAVVADGWSGHVQVTTAKGMAELAGFVYSPVVKSCKLPGFGGEVGLGFPISSMRVPSRGTVKVNVVFVDFSDSPATEPAAQLFNEHILPSAQFFNAVSYGKMTLEFIPTLRWFRVSKPSDEIEPSDYIFEAASLADAMTDFSQSHAIFVVAPPEAEAIKGGAAYFLAGDASFAFDGQSFYNAAVSGTSLKLREGMLFAHEFGHLLGLPDLYKHQADPRGLHAFVGAFSTMGIPNGGGKEMFGFERWLVGWLTDEQVVCQLDVGEGRVKLTPIEKGGGTKLLVIPIGTSRAVVVECRRALGYDNQLTKEGPLVYLVDTRVATGSGPIRILPDTGNDLSKINNIMDLNQILNFENVSITYQETDEDGDELFFKKN